MSITPRSRPYLILKPTEKLPTKQQLGPDLFAVDKEQKVSMEAESRKCRKFAVLNQFFPQQ